MTYKKAFLKKLICFIGLFTVAIFAYADGSALQDPLCFTARDGSVTVKFKKNVTHDIEYKKNDNGGWTTYVSETGIDLNADEKVYFRAKENQTEETAKAFSSNFSFGGNGTVEASGNIMSLYGPSCPNLQLPENAFINLFKDCKILTTAPELPATNLGKSCYQYMFQGCTSLKTAPALPATELVETCYQRMFQNCTSLTTAPDLPATNLAKSCYSYMFNGCTFLTKAPDLPATELAEACYQSMFYKCTSLTKAPDLPATDLKKGCYQGMFLNCIELETAPALPAETLAENCYSYMFNGCTALTTAPALPATDLKEGCYQNMFTGCSNLTTAPALPATTLAKNCYYRMFSDCSSLKINSVGPGVEWSIPAGATVGTNSTTDMFSGTVGSFKGAPEVGTTYYISYTPDDVKAMIDAIGTVVFTDKCDNLIKSARAAYNTLTDDQKASISTELAKLTNAEAAYAKLADDPTTGINVNIFNTSKTVKFFENGKLVIIRNGVKYDVAGQVK